MNNIKVNKEGYSLRTIIISLILGIVGIALISVSFIMKDANQIIVFTVGSIGTSSLTIGVISFFYEVLLRNSFIKISQESLKNILEEEKEMFIKVSKEEREKFQIYFEKEKDELITHLNEEKNEIEKILKQIIVDSMPPKYVNIKRAGIVDAYEFLEIEKLRQKIDRLEKKEFKILKIWTPTLNLLEQTIIDAIDVRDCKFRIALLNPRCTEAIEKRALSLNDYDKDQIIAEIVKNLRRCKSIYNRLKNKVNFEVKIYDAFISIPLYGYGNSYIMGLYLHNRLSEGGIQLKISGVTNRMYKKIDDHFESVWNLAEMIDFENIDFLDVYK